MRDPAGARSPDRRVLCTHCDTELGVTGDPLDAILMARRHGRELRRGR
jgi:hypothetical protein